MRKREIRAGEEGTVICSLSEIPWVPHPEVSGLERGTLVTAAVGRPAWFLTRIPAGATVPLHATATTDYVIVIAGSVELLFEDGSASMLSVGHFVVQHGRSHGWHNPGSEAAVLSVVMSPTRT
ncbi:MAG TPA: hypothetical protein VMV09_06985 [Candidatus Saccharimonadales bacterium]|nr:hypothetical protein [Candidatus Saccharimonadales bacterium]